MSVCVREGWGCSTHVQVWWDVCRVHGLSLSSSVTIPWLVLLLLWIEWTKWTFCFLPLFVSFYSSQTLRVSPISSKSLWVMLLVPFFFFPFLSAPLLSFSSCCHCQISKLLKTSTGFPLACLTSHCKRHPFSFACAPSSSCLKQAGRATRNCRWSVSCVSVCNVSPAKPHSCF